MRIATFGGMGETCQLPRINKALRNMGHEVDANNPDGFYHLAYSNDPNGKVPYDDINNCSADVKIKNVLDIPEHLIEGGTFSKEDLAAIKKGLKQNKPTEIKHHPTIIKEVWINYITAISKTTENQIKKWLNIDVDKVIYNPIQDLPEVKGKKENRIMYVGRANDSNKRFDLGVAAAELFFDKIGEKFERKIHVYGSDAPLPHPIIDYHGVVSNDELAESYAKSNFLLFPSKVEGIGLPMIEAMKFNCAPITCNDNQCAIEFKNSLDWPTNPTPEDMCNRMLEIFMKRGSLSFDNRSKELTDLFSPCMVANRIVSLYKDKI